MYYTIFLFFIYIYFWHWRELQRKIKKKAEKLSEIWHTDNTLISLSLSHTTLHSPTICCECKRLFFRFCFWGFDVFFFFFWAFEIRFLINMSRTCTAPVVVCVDTCCPVTFAAVSGFAFGVRNLLSSHIVYPSLSLSFFTFPQIPILGFWFVLSLKNLKLMWKWRLYYLIKVWFSLSMPL